MNHEYWEAYEAALPSERRGYARTNPLCRAAAMSDEIEIEFGCYDDGQCWSAKHGVVIVFRDSLLEAICALLEDLAV